MAQTRATKFNPTPPPFYRHWALLCTDLRRTTNCAHTLRMDLFQREGFKPLLLLLPSNADIQVIKQMFSFFPPSH